MLDMGKEDLDFRRILQIKAQRNPELTPVHEGHIGHSSKKPDRVGFITRTAAVYYGGITM